MTNIKIPETNQDSRVTLIFILMEKIFINENAVYLVEQKLWEHQQAIYPNNDAQEYIKVPPEFDWEGFLYSMEQSNSAKSILLIHPDIKYLKKKFHSYFQTIKAAGGVVLNEKNELLIIYRRGKWDLPKGKMDDGEEIEETAVREVMEETGLKQVQIRKRLDLYGTDQKGTLHTYIEKGSRIIKLTCWFEMKTDQPGELVPEEREGITEVKWVSPEYLQPFLQDTYRSLLDVFSKYVDL